MKSKKNVQNNDARFEPSGPWPVPTYNGKAAKIIDTQKLHAFWESLNDIGDKKGCYIFAIRASKGVVPYYVGKATKTLKQEAFALHKLEKYQRCLADINKGTPVLYFVTLGTRKGKPNVKAITELEQFLIQSAVSRNADLLNVKGTDRARWSIDGVLGSRSGQPSTAASSLKKLLGLSPQPLRHSVTIRGG